MADERIVLQAIAETRAAIAELRGLVGQVDAIGTAVTRNSGKKLTIDADQATASIDKLEKQLSRLEEKSKKQNLLSIKVDEAGLTKSLAAVEREVAKTERAVAAAIKKMEREAARNIFGGLDESAKKTNRALTAEFRSLSAAFDAAVTKLNQASRRGGFDPLSESARKLRENIRIAAEDLVGFGSKVPKAVGAAGPALEAFNAKMRDAARAVATFRKEEPIGPSFLSSITAAKTAIAGFISALAIRPLIDFGKAAFDTAVKVETLTNRLTGLLGEKAGQEELENLKRIADQLGISFLDLADNFGTFSLAAREQGFTAQETRDIFEAVAVTIRGAGLNTEQAGRVLNAFTQIMQKGKIQAEELVKQLGQIIPASTLLQKSLGLTGDEFVKLQASGDITAKNLLALSRTLIDAYGPAAQKNIESSAAQLARFDNAVVEVKNSLGKELLPAVNELLGALIQTGKDGENNMEAIGKAIGEVIRGMAILAEAFNEGFDGSRLEAAFRNLTASAIESFADIEEHLRGMLRTVALISPALSTVFAAFDIAASNNIQLLRESATAAREQAAAILESYAAQKSGAEEAAKAQEDLQRRLAAAAQESSSKQLAESKALTAAQKAELVTRKRDYEEYLNFLASKRGQITADERAELAKREAAYEDLKKKLIAKDEELSDKLRKELDKRRGLIKSYVTDIATLANQAAAQTVGAPQIQGPSGAPPSLINPQDTDKVRELREELARLKAEKAELEADPNLDLDQANRLGEVGADIFEVEQKLRNIPSAAASAGQSIQQAAAQAQAATSAFSAQFLQQLNQMVTGSDEFRQQFSQLSPSAQQAVDLVISSYRRLAAAGQATQDDQVLFLSRIVQALHSTGAGASEMATTFESAMRVASGAVDPVSESLNKLKTPIDSVASAATAATSPIETVGKTIRSVGEEAETAKVSIDAAGNKVIELGGKKPAETAAEGIADIGTAAGDTAKKVEEATKPVEDFGTVVGGASSKTDEASTAANKLNTELAELPGHLDAIAKAAPTIAPALQELGTSLSTATTPAADIASVFLELAGHLAAIEASIPTVIESINSLKALGDEQTGEGGIAKLAAALDQLVSAAQPLAESLTAAKTALETIKTASEGMPEVVDALNQAFAKFSTDAFVTQANNAKTAAEEASTAIKTAGTSTSEWATALDAVKTNMAAALTSMSGIKDAAATFAKAVNEEALPALREMATEFRKISEDSPIFERLLRYIVDSGVQGMRDLAVEVKNLAVTIREDLIPAAQDAAEAVGSIKLPGQGG